MADGDEDFEQAMLRAERREEAKILASERHGDEESLGTSSMDDEHPPTELKADRNRQRSDHSEDLEETGHDDEMRQPRQWSSFQDGVHEDELSDQISSPGGEGDQEDQKYGLRQNPKPSRRFVDHKIIYDEFLPAPPASVIQGATLGLKTPAPPGATALGPSSMAKKTGIKQCKCTECGKEFHSAKALFGHMRCHPERQWRGINRPENLPLKRPKELQKPRAWPILPTLKTAPGLSEEESLRQGELSADEAEHVSVEGAEFDSSGQIPGPPMLRAKRSKRARHTAQLCDRETADCLVMLAGGSAGDPLSALNRAPKYQCTTCDRVFKTHQALGGHRASHKKYRGCPGHRREEDEGGDADVEDNDADGDGEVDVGVQHGEVGTSQTKPGVHECTICGRLFKSGQALGGHKRCHWSSHDDSQLQDSPHAPTPPGLHVTLGPLPMPNKGALASPGERRQRVGVSIAMREVMKLIGGFNAPMEDDMCSKLSVANMYK